MDIDIKNIKAALAEMDRKKAAVLGAAALCLFIFAGAAYTGASRYIALKRMTAVKKEDIGRFNDVRAEYLRKKALLDSVANKAYSGGGQSAVAVVEGVCASIGVKPLISTLKPLEEKEVLGYKDKGVEVRLEKMDLNQLVNLLYQLDNDRALIVVKEFSMKSRFEDPNLLDVTLKLSVVEKKA